MVEEGRGREGGVKYEKEIMEWMREDVRKESRMEMEKGSGEEE